MVLDFVFQTSLWRKASIILKVIAVDAEGEQILSIIFQIFCPLWSATPHCLPRAALRCLPSTEGPCWCCRHANLTAPILAELLTTLPEYRRLPKCRMSLERPTPRNRSQCQPASIVFHSSARRFMILVKIDAPPPKNFGLFGLKNGTEVIRGQNSVANRIQHRPRIPNLAQASRSLVALHRRLMTSRARGRLFGRMLGIPPVIAAAHD